MIRVDNVASYIIECWKIHRILKSECLIDIKTIITKQYFEHPSALNKCFNHLHDIIIEEKEQGI